MSKIGSLQTKEIEGKKHLFGTMRTLQHNLKLHFAPNQNSAGQNAPAFSISAIQNDSTEIDIGAAWVKNMRSAEQGISEFLSITIDDPSFGTPLNVAAFENAEGGYDITFRRRQTQNQKL